MRPYFKSLRSSTSVSLLVSLVLGAFTVVTIALPPAAGQSARGAAVATLPSATDSKITEADQPHMSWLPVSSPNNQLLVFLPGTGGAPKANFPFAETAANLGYHVISLMYPDNVAAQQRCSRSPDPNAYLTFRQAIIQGGAMGPQRTITPADSIESRLAHLLVYLDAQQPNQGWGHFLDASKRIDWKNIAIAGQSQGGGHAYMVGKLHSVARVLMFGSPKDYSFYFQAPAKGFDGDTKTPLGRYFTFNHLEDNGNGCTHEQQMQILKQIGLSNLGIASVEQAGRNFNNAHVLITDVPVNGPKGYHGSVISNFPICLQVWKYMLTTPVTD